MTDQNTDPKDDVEFTFEPIPQPPPPPPVKKGLLSKLGPIGLLLFFLFGKLKYLAVILQVGKFKTFITMLIRRGLPERSPATQCAGRVRRTCLKTERIR